MSVALITAADGVYHPTSVALIIGRQRRQGRRSIYPDRIFLIDNSSGRSAIYRLPTRKLLAVDRIFIYGFVSLISVVTGNGNPLHFKSIFPVMKPTASYLPHPNPCFALGSHLHRQWSLLRGYRPLMRPIPCLGK